MPVSGRGKRRSGRSNLELHGPRNGHEFNPREPRLGGSPSSCALDSDGGDETGRLARRRRFSRGPGGRSGAPPRETYDYSR
eukprot:10034051-Alexandrium_andersonii.AAC.1